MGLLLQWLKPGPAALHTVSFRSRGHSIQRCLSSDDKGHFLLLAFTGHTNLLLVILADTGATLMVITSTLRLMRGSAHSVQEESLQNTTSHHMRNRKKEFAKFLCGGEAFHAIFHVYLLLSGTELTVLGITTTPSSNIVSVAINAGISLALGLYAWRQSPPPGDS